MREHLKYLQDRPRFDDSWVGSKPKDKFKHSGYIEGLYNLILQCQPPFCFGLFGGWGTGKTGIVLGLRDYIISKSDHIKCLYFDVWEYSADSIRRQLLLKIDEVWFDKKLDYANKLYINTKRTITSKNSINWKTFWKINGILSVVYIFFFVMVYNISPVGFLGKNDKWLEMIGLILIPILIAVISSFQNKNDLETIVEDSSKPYSPEQFEFLFKEALNHETIKDKRKVFIIDNLDRCNSDRVMEVLTGISTFLGESECIYVIPCDETRIKEHIKRQFSIEQQGDVLFEDEFIRKLFNAHIGLRQVVEEDLMNYLNDLVIEIGITDKKQKDDLITILFSGIADNPRKAKQLLNNFVSSYNLALDIENQQKDNSSLSKGIISNNPGFLLKAIVIQNYYSTAYKDFTDHLGLYRAYEEFLNLCQSENPTNIPLQYGKLSSQTSGNYTLKNFLEATPNVTSNNHDVFFRFYGSPDSELEEKIKLTINFAARKNQDELETILLENISNIDFINSLKIKTISNLRSIGYTLDLKANILSSLLRVCEKINNDELNVKIGEIIEDTKEDVIRHLGYDFDPEIWELWNIGFINDAKMESIGRIIYNTAKQLLLRKNADDSITKEIIWQSTKSHIIAVNELYDKISEDLRDKYREILKEILLIDLVQETQALEDCWVWLINEKPELTQNRLFVDSIAENLPSQINTQFDFAGSFVTQSYNIAETKTVDKVFDKIIELFEPGLTKFDVTHQLYPPTLLLHFILGCNRKFSKKTGESIFNTLTLFRPDMEKSGYEYLDKWFEGLVELYNNYKEFKVRQVLVESVKEFPDKYESELERTNYYNNSYLSIEMFDAVASLPEAKVNSDPKRWKKYIVKILRDTFSYKLEKINKIFLQQYIESKNEYAHIICIYIIESIAENINLYSNTKEFILGLINNLLDINFWANSDETIRNSFFKAIMSMIDVDTIGEAEKDNMIEPILKNEFQTLEMSEKEMLKSIRTELYNRLSPQAKERVLNNIWTKYDNRLNEDNIDIEFLLANFENAEDTDRHQIVKELFDQLNVGNVSLFSKYGFYNNVIVFDEGIWLSKITPFIEQNIENSNYKNIIDLLKEKLPILKDCTEKTKLMSVLNPLVE